MTVCIVVLAPFSISACGGKKMYSVEGKVVWEDDSPASDLEGGTVQFDATDASIGSQGTILKDGVFKMTTVKPGDGVPTGEYRVLVTQPPSRKEIVVWIIDKRFSNYDSSGLQFTVEKKSRKDVVFKVARAKKE